MASIEENKTYTDFMLVDIKHRSGLIKGGVGQNTTSLLVN